MIRPAGDRMLRAGVVGLGVMGRNHVRVYADLPGVEVVSVADPEPDALRHATSGRSARGHSDPFRMLAEEELDLVSIASPTSLHHDLTIAALERGASVLVEKPIAPDRAEAEAMIAAAERAGRLLTVGHIERFNPAVRELQRRLARRELGRIFQVRAERLGPFPARIRDVGVVIDLATHDLDVMRFLLGSDPSRLYAESERRIHTDHEDLFCGLIKFENAAVGMLDINWLTPTKKREISVTGERGMFVADYITQDLTFYGNSYVTDTWENSGPDAFGPVVTSISEGEMTRLHVARAEPLAVELDEFVKAVRRGGPPPVDPRDAMIAVVLARMMVESALRGEVVSGRQLTEALA